MKIYIDGEYYEGEEAKISVYDHGLLYGDGVFEGIRVYGGRAFRLEEHIRRLFESARAIGLEVPLSPEGMSQVVEESIRSTSTIGTSAVTVMDSDTWTCMVNSSRAV